MIANLMGVFGGFQNKVLCHLTSSLEHLALEVPEQVLGRIWGLVLKFFILNLQVSDM